MLIQLKGNRKQRYIELLKKFKARSGRESDYNERTEAFIKSKEIEIE